MSRIDLSTNGVVPGLTANDLKASVHFYAEGLGFSVESQDEVDGVPQFVMLKAGKGLLGLSQDDFAKGRDRAKGAGFSLWIETDQDLNALAHQVKAIGVTLDSEVKPLSWGALGFAVTDPDGFKLTISNPR